MRTWHACLSALGTGLWIASFAWSFEGTCHAQDAGAADASASPGADAGATDAGDGAVRPALEPPRLLYAATAPYPDAARAAGIAGTVVLDLTIDATGAVTDAVVTRPLGHGLDEAARDAALRSRFSPARRAGQPIRARIHFDYQFTVPAPPAAPPPAPPAATDVTVKGRSNAQRLRESAAAVTVVETREAKTESADLAKVLARVPGISIRRSGGLGSYARVALNGLTDEQIRYYLDEVPLDIAGFGLGLQNTPVNFLDRVEIYRGIVPVRFGADALGGVFNLVAMDDVRGTHANTSLELGSFGTLRFTASARTLLPRSGLFAAMNVFIDRADNDYLADVLAPNAVGQEVPARVRLFHNAYAAEGAMVDIGLVDRAWAKRLILRVFANRQDNDLQSNFTMTVPYGEARYGETTVGANLRYEQPRIAGSPFGTTALLAYGRRNIAFQDLSPWVYSWFGQRTDARTTPGELGLPTDQILWDDKVTGRVTLAWNPLTWQEARLAVAPTYDHRTGRNLLRTSELDSLRARYRYLTVFLGAEYEVNLFERRLQSITFAKAFSYNTWSEERKAATRTEHGQQAIASTGWGEELRFRFAPTLWAKASYEHTTRFPSPQEVFGNGVLTLANPALRPERSHNANLSLTLDRHPTRWGEVRAEVNLFFRQASDLIVFMTNTMNATYVNVNDARSTGIELGAGWSSPRGTFVLDGNATWQDFRNISTTGTFAKFEGDRIVNRPWLIANLSARANKEGLFAPTDKLSLGYYFRYVYEYLRSWESVGALQTKQLIPTQVTHDLVLTYGTRGKHAITWTLEVDNLTDARVFDFYGLQRPGRATYAKVMVEY